MPKPKITAKQENGDDGHCYVVRCNGVEIINGLTRSEVPYYKKRALEMYEENPARFGGKAPAPKKPVDQNEVRRISNMILGEVQDACSEMGYEHGRNPKYADDDVQKKIRAAKKKGVSDICGWLADEYFNDAQLLEDLIGDKLCDECRNDMALRSAVCDEMADGAHLALKKATANLKRD